jgi:hypothetical protein
MAILANNPSPGFVRWESAKMLFEGTVRSITNGQTDKRYIYWLASSPTTFQVSDTWPILGTNDCLVFTNLSGSPISVLEDATTHGSAVAEGSVDFKQLAAEAVRAQHVAANSITGTHIQAGSINTDHLTAGSVNADKIDVTDLFSRDITVTGLNGRIKSEHYSEGTVGFYMGRHPVHGADYFEVSNAVIRGTISAGAGSSIPTSALPAGTQADITNGATAHSETVQYRTPGAPTNLPAFDVTPVSDAQVQNGEIVATVSYTYTQGALAADFILVFIREGGGTVVASDDCHVVNPVTGTLKFTVKPNTAYRWGLAAVRRTENGLESTAIVQGANYTTLQSKISASGALAPNNFWNLQTGELRAGTLHNFIRVVPAVGLFEIAGLDLELTESDLKTFLGDMADRHALSHEEVSMVWRNDSPDDSVYREVARIGYDGKAGKVVAEEVHRVLEVAPSVSTFSGLSSHQRFTSQVYNGKLYLPQNGGQYMDIYNLATGTKTTVAGLSSTHSRNTSQIYQGKLYLPRSGGKQVDVINLQTDTVQAIYSSLSTHQRDTSQLHAGKLYLPESWGPNMDIYDTDTNTKTTFSGLSSHGRSTSQIYQGKLYLPEHGGPGMDIYDLATGLLDSTVSVLSSHSRQTSQIYQGKMYLPQSGGANMDIYDFATGTKTTVTGLPSHQREVSFVVNGKLYLPQSYGTDAVVYDFATGLWGVISLGPSSPGRSTGQIYQGKLYLPENGGVGMDIVTVATTEDIASDDPSYKSITFARPDRGAKIGYNEEFDKVVAEQVHRIVRTGFLESTFSGLSNHARGLSVVYKGKMYLPQSDGTNMDIFNLETGLLESTFTGLTNQSRGMSVVYQGKLYLPQTNGTNMDIYDLETGLMQYAFCLSNHWRYAWHIYQEKLYLFQSSGTEIDIYDFDKSQCVTSSVLSNHGRWIGVVDAGKIYLPQHNGTEMDIYDFATGTKITITGLTNFDRRTAQIYKGKLYLPQNGGVNMHIYNIATQELTTFTGLSNHNRWTSQLYEGKLYLPQRSGTGMDIVDLSDNSVRTITNLSSHNRLTSQLYQGKLYLPENGGVGMDIVDLATTEEITSDDPSYKSITFARPDRGAKIGYSEAFDKVVVENVNLKVNTNSFLSSARGNVPNKVIAIVNQGKVYLPSSAEQSMDIFDLGTHTFQAANSLSSTTRSRGVVYNNRMFLPGNQSATMDIYNFTTGVFSTVSNIPSALKMANALVGNILYMREWSTATLHRYNLDTLSSAGTAFSLSGSYSCRNTAVYNGKIYMLPEGATYMDVFDTTTNINTPITGLPSASRGCCAVYQNFLYMFRNSSFLEILNMDTNDLEVIPFEGGTKQQCVVSGTKIYIIVPTADNPVMIVFDIPTRVRTVYPLPTVGLGYDIQPAVVGDKVYVFSSTDTVVNIFTPFEVTNLAAPVHRDLSCISMSRGNIAGLAGPANVDFYKVIVRDLTGVITYDSANRRFIVSEHGLYQVNFSGFGDTGATAFEVVLGLNNSSATRANCIVNAYSNTATYKPLSFNAIVRLSPGDHLYVRIVQGTMYGETSANGFNNISIVKLSGVRGPEGERGPASFATYAP